MRPLAWFAGGFGAACLLACYGLGGLWSAAAAALLGVLGLAAWLRARPRGGESPDVTLLPRVRRVRFEAGRRLTALCLGGVLAIGWFWGYSALFCTPAQELAGTEQTISGTVTSYPNATSIGGYAVTVRLDGGLRAPDVLLYGSSHWGDLSPGDRVRCTARLKPSDRLHGDETSYYTAKGVFLLGYCNDPPEVERARSVPVRYWPALCARTLRDGIYTAFDERTAPLAAAVTLGDKTGLDEQFYSALNRSGVMHAAVVSGMHISFLVSVLLILCRGSRRAALCTLPLLLFYALMAGGTPSALRAVIMQAALLAGPVLGRENDPPSSLGLALLILLIQNPFAAASVSLQLSFGAVVGILLVSGRLHRGLLRPVKAALRGRNGAAWKLVWQVCRFVAASLSASLGAMLLTVPLIALYFGHINILSPLTNILVLWAVTILMVAALVLGTMAIVLPRLAGVLGLPFDLLGHYVRAVVTAIGAWPLATLSVTFIRFRIWLAAVYLYLPAFVFSKRRWRQAGIALLCAALLLGGAVVFNDGDSRRADLTVTALDVGQGASTLFVSGGCAALVDCGGNGADLAGDTAADHLAAMGRHRLDLLVLTHLDDDHCNGVAQLFYRLDVAQVAVPDVETHGEKLAWLAELAREEGAELILVTEQQTIPLGEAQFTLYPPLGRGTSNEEGLFALCSAGDFDILMTGDADSFVERMLVKYYPLPDIEVLMAGHHGAKGSTCQELLDALRPELAVISAGENSYGHPPKETLERLELAGAQIYRTDESGAVTITLSRGRVAVQEMRKTR